MDETPGGTDDQLTCSAALGDPAYRAAVIDLLGVIAYGELSAFERLVDDAKLAPTLGDKIDLTTMAAAEFAHVQPLLNRITALGGHGIAAMEPFVAPFETFHTHTAPRDWLEGLVKAFVGDGLAADFYLEIAAFLDQDTRRLVIDSLEEAGDQSDFVVDRVRRAIVDDPRVAGRLALWGRRLMGEALSQAQRVAAERDALTALLAGGDRPGMDLAAMGRMFTRLTENHTHRMERLGLDS